MTSRTTAAKGASLSIVRGVAERSCFAGRRRSTFFPDALISDRVETSSCMYRRDLRAHYGCVNAIEFSTGDGRMIASGGDDRRILLWDVERALSDAGSPAVMKGEHHSNVFCVAFNNSNTKVFSGGNDEQVLVHEVDSCRTLNLFMHEDAVYGLAVDPVNDDVFASACDDGKVHIYDLRAPPSEGAFELASYASPMHAVVYNPAEPRLIATANAKEGVGLWDIRRPKACLLRYGSASADESCMSVRFNYVGDRLLALRRRLPPVLYRLDCPTAHVQFNHAGYHNSCTMKSCSFAGSRDQYVLSGSDEFNLYMWKIPEEPIDGMTRVGHAHMVLRGHRSIVNQVRYNKSSALMISSGVEKVIKVWSPFDMPGADTSTVVGRSLPGDDRGRAVMHHIDYLEMMLRNGHAMAHDYSHQSTDEDPHMIAFFDSLVRRERDGWTSDEDEESLSRDDDIDDHALDYHHTEQSSSDESASEGNRRPQSGVVFRPLRYPQPRESTSSPLDGTASAQQSTTAESDLDPQSRVHRRRKSRRAMLRRLGRMIPITSFVSSHSPSDDSTSESTSTTTVDSSSEDTGDSEASSTSKSSEASKPADQSPSRELAGGTDLCCQIADPLTIKQTKDSLGRLKRLRERALNSDDDSGEFSSSSPPAAKHIAIANPLPPTVSADFCDNLLDGCKSPVKLNGKSQSCSESANGDICRLSDFTRTTVVAESHDGASVSNVGRERQSSSSVDQELCSILNQVSNGDATAVEAAPAERFHSRQRTKSGSRRYRRAIVDSDVDHTSDED